MAVHFIDHNNIYFIMGFLMNFRIKRTPYYYC